MTAEELRAEILRVVMKNGGHLASSLGAVEIALALSEVFDPEKDRIVWDVGHQAYAWKLLTERGGKTFDSLRKLDGMSPFPTPLESKADAAVSGHAGVAISVAEGMSAARELLGGNENEVAVVGDGAIANGTSLEALNNLASACEKVIVVLNDNEMSISRPTGSLAKLLGRLITNVGYNRAKAAAESAGHRMKLTFLRGMYHALESRVKSWFLGNAYFEQFGLRYIGPVNGHSLSELKAAFTVAKEDKRSVIVHVVTKKGKGYAPAEQSPTRFHGIGGSSSTKAAGISWSDAFGAVLSEMARKDERIVALTAGMTDGTGLSGFAQEFPRRFYDVGISEGHMVAFAAGMAARGMRPVVAVYSTFLQRAVDQVMHDVAIAKLPVVFCVDRAGVVGADGKTHHGVFDIPMFRALPNMTIGQPCNEGEFRQMLAEAFTREGPTVIRYPRGNVPQLQVPSSGGLAEQLMGADCEIQIWATGDQIGKALEVARRIGAGVVYARYLKPFDAELLARHKAERKRIVSLENGSAAGGFGEAIGADCKIGWPDEFIPHGSIGELEKKFGMDVDSIVRRING